MLKKVVNQPLSKNGKSKDIGDLNGLKTQPSLVFIFAYCLFNSFASFFYMVS